MAKKKNKKLLSDKDRVVFHQSAEEATLARMPKYNGYAVGHGAFGDTKYSRTKEKRKFNKWLNENEY